VTATTGQRALMASAPASRTTVWVGRHAGELIGIGPDEGIDTGLGNAGPPNVPWGD
jgi:hypothetical protein